MSDYIRHAFDGDDVVKKNLALRKAHDEIERLRAENARIREAAAKALKTADGLDQWHKYGEGYGWLRDFVAGLAGQEKKG